MTVKTKKKVLYCTTTVPAVPIQNRAGFLFLGDNDNENDNDDNDDNHREDGDPIVTAVLVKDDDDDDDDHDDDINQQQKAPPLALASIWRGYWTGRNVSFWRLWL
mmetsp:Transcript_19014/g.45934  ORF Transcript_19014/g.45934 Transcript_19014/m.45934 type:complete len:105 (+) Transcript_19014:539-853(+)